MITATVSEAIPYLVTRGRNDILTAPSVTLSLEKDVVTINFISPGNRLNAALLTFSAGKSACLHARDATVFSVIKEMVNWIDNHLDEMLTVERISRKSGYSVWHFQRKFSQLTGFNVSEFVRRRRVINATFSLIFTNKSIIDIAVENGFNCQASFTRTVRALTHLTPGRIKRLHAGNEHAFMSVINILMNPARLL